MRATVIIPTLRRPGDLERAIRSVFALSDLTQVQALVVIDNDPLASARAIADRLTPLAPFPLIYGHEPRAGIANARNAGLRLAPEADYIAFLDDDEIASPQWLSELLKVQHALEADVVFGPISGVAPTARKTIRPVVEAFFSRLGSERDGLAPHPYGCGNSLMKRSTALTEPDPFCISANQTGGEDDILFSKLARQGARFGWASQAWVDEHAPPHRAKLSYLLQRGFARGQGPSQTAAHEGKHARLAFWMSIGLAQFGLYGLCALVAGSGLTRTGSRLLIRAIEGLGKIFWFKMFEPKLYGVSELSKRS